MTEWFKQRYVSRDEHEQVIAYYRKLVANLQVTIEELRQKANADVIDMMMEHAEQRHHHPVSADDNVITVDFRRVH